MPAPVIDAPFSAWPVQKGGPSVFGVAWYTKPAAFVTQSHVEHGTVAGALLAEAVIDRLLACYSAEVSAAGGLLVIHDWRRVKSFDPRLIQFYSDRLTVRGRRAIRAIVLGLQMSTLARLALQAVGGTIARVHGFEAEISRDLAASLLKFNVQRPDPTIDLG